MSDWTSHMKWSWNLQDIVDLARENGINLADVDVEVGNDYGDHVVEISWPKDKEYK